MFFLANMQIFIEESGKKKTKWGMVGFSGDHRHHYFGYLDVFHVLLVLISLFISLLGLLLYIFKKAVEVMAMVLSAYRIVFPPKMVVIHLKFLILPCLSVFCL